MPRACTHTFIHTPYQHIHTHAMHIYIFTYFMHKLVLDMNILTCYAHLCITLVYVMCTNAHASICAMHMFIHVMCTHIHSFLLFSFLSIRNHVRILLLTSICTNDESQMAIGGPRSLPSFYTKVLRWRRFALNARIHPPYGLEVTPSSHMTTSNLTWPIWKFHICPTGIPFHLKDELANQELRTMACRRLDCSASRGLLNIPAL